MKLVPITDIFDIRYGNQFDLSKMDILSDGVEGISFVSRSSENNGNMAMVGMFNDIEPFEAWLITVTLGGSYLLASFVQPKPFYTGQNIKVLKPKLSLSEQEKLYYCTCIEANRFRYSSHSREANSTFNQMMVPTFEEIPQSVKSHKIDGVFEEPPLSNRKLTLDTKSWKWFRYDEVFIIEKGYYNKKPDEVENGEMIFIGATESNNGITSYHSENEIEKTYEWNCITVSNDGSVGSAFYQERYFTCSHSVNVLRPKTGSWNQYSALFVCTLIEKEKYRWAYGRKWRPARMPDSKIKLPTTSAWSPDWQWMEDYIKGLPYSANL